MLSLFTRSLHLIIIIVVVVVVVVVIITVVGIMTALLFPYAKCYTYKKQ